MSDFVFSTGTIVVIAAALQTIAYLFSNQITLRFLLLVGTVFYLVYYFIAADDPLWPAIFGTSCIGITSIYGFARTIASKSKWTITKAHLPIFEKMHDIEPGAFRKLMKTAKIKTFDERQLLTETGVVPDHVLYTLEGEVDVNKHDHIFQMPAFNFIGEISIIGGFAATATVYSQVGTKAVVWDRKRLLAQMHKDERFRVAVEALFAKDMAIKLSQAAKVDARG